MGDCFGVSADQGHTSHVKAFSSGYGCNSSRWKIRYCHSTIERERVGIVVLVVLMLFSFVWRMAIRNGLGYLSCTSKRCLPMPPAVGSTCDFSGYPQSIRCRARPVSLTYLKRLQQVYSKLKLWNGSPFSLFCYSPLALLWPLRPQVPFAPV